MSYPNLSFSWDSETGAVRIVAELTVATEKCPRKGVMVADPDREVLEVEFFENEGEPNTLGVDFSFST